jgi:outer membrane lipoprotein-sorting protein
VNCERIELREAGVDDGQKIEAFIATATGMPVRLSYGIAFLNTDAVVDVVRITTNVALDRTSFSYDPGRYASYDIVDFR